MTPLKKLKKCQFCTNAYRRKWLENGVSQLSITLDFADFDLFSVESYN